MPLATRAALLLPDQVEAGVDAGRGARAGDHWVVVHVEHIRVDLGGREPASQIGRVPPVGGAPAAVEQPGLAEDERPAADVSSLAPRSTAARSSASSGSGYWRGPSLTSLTAGTRDQVGLGQPVKTELGRAR